VTEKKLISFDAVDDEPELADIIAAGTVNAASSASTLADVAAFAAPSSAPSVRHREITRLISERATRTAPFLSRVIGLYGHWTN